MTMKLMVCIVLVVLLFLCSTVSVTNNYQSEGNYMLFVSNRTRRRKSHSITRVHHPVNDTVFPSNTPSELYLNSTASQVGSSDRPPAQTKLLSRSQAPRLSAVNTLPSGEKRSINPTDRRSTSSAWTGQEEEPLATSGIVDPRVSRKQELAKVLRAQYQDYRRRLEEEQLQSRMRKAFRGRYFIPLRGGQSTYPHNVPHNVLESPTVRKKHRSAEEASATRLGILPPDAHPFESRELSPSGESYKPPLKVQEEDDPKTVLEGRLGPTAPSRFDPSIVIDFLRTVKVPQPQQRVSSTVPEKLSAVRQLPRVKSVVYFPPEEDDDGARVTSRNIDMDYVIGPFHNMATYYPEATKEKHVPVRNQEMQSVTNGYETRRPEVEGHWSGRRTQLLKEALKVHKHSRQESSSKERPDHHNEFGPYSDGAETSVGVDPASLTVPKVDPDSLNLPQGVKDTIRKYLTPLLESLKPLRQSIPGLPGLDYPILDVVPYTTFYCVDMPWPGFYADTEARCQAWHACDADGRQSTFLCPNGTVFNQALMVCDWWYNTDCLSSPLLYLLNDRLFGNRASQDHVTPHRRITPELLDTIFISPQHHNQHKHY